MFLIINIRLFLVTLGLRFSTNICDFNNITCIEYNSLDLIQTRKRSGAISERKLYDIVANDDDDEAEEDDYFFGIEEKNSNMDYDVIDNFIDREAKFKRALR